MRAFRVGDADGRYPIYSGQGSARSKGRWHKRGQEVIYSSRYYSTALLESLARWNLGLPLRQHYIEINIPSGISYETVTAHSFPKWVDDERASAFGAKWHQEKRSLILIVPSYVARIDENVVINCSHPDFPKLQAGLEYPVFWDERLFSNS